MSSQAALLFPASLTTEAVKVVVNITQRHNFHLHTVCRSNVRCLWNPVTPCDDHFHCDSTLCSTSPGSLYNSAQFWTYFFTSYNKNRWILYIYQEVKAFTLKRLFTHTGGCWATWVATAARRQTDGSVATNRPVGPAQCLKSHSYQAMWVKRLAQGHNGRDDQGQTGHSSIMGQPTDLLINHSYLEYKPVDQSIFGCFGA